MDQRTLNELRDALETDRQAQLDLLEEHGASVDDDAVRNLEIGNESFADSGQATEARSELLGQLQSARERVRSIDAALSRVETGTYGQCVDCGEPIAVDRLRARPFSSRCVRCAERRDRA